MPNGSGSDHGRQELLLKMYDQLFNDINTHIIVVWQSVGVVVCAFALLALVEKISYRLTSESPSLCCCAAGFWRTC